MVIFTESFFTIYKNVYLNSFILNIKNHHRFRLNLFVYEYRILNCNTPVDYKPFDEHSYCVCVYVCVHFS